MKRFFKRHIKGILLTVGISAATIAAYLLAHNAATMQRGYEAIGGEMFIFLIPAFIVLFAPEEKEAAKGADNNELD